MKRLTIENFRNIDKEITLDLTQINILTGANNSGKSNILKLLVVLADYFTSDNHFRLSFNGPSAGKHKIDCYQNAINWGNWNNNQCLKFSYEVLDYTFSFEFIPSIQKITTDKSLLIQTGRLNKFESVNRKNHSKITISGLSEHEYELYADQTFLDSLASRPNPGNVNEVKERLTEEISYYQQNIDKLIDENDKLKKSDKKYLDNIDEISGLNRRLEHARDRMKDIEANDTTENSGISFNRTFRINEEEEYSNLTIPGIVREILETYFRDENENEEGYSNKRSVSSNLFGFSNNLNRILNISTIHLSPDRSHQSRIYMNSDKTSEISEIISYMVSNPFRKGSSADRFLKKWMKNFKIGTNCYFKNIEGIATAIEIEENNATHNLVDKGFGAGQILAIILRIAEYLEKYGYNPVRIKRLLFRSLPPLLIFEEPEANLHPAFQSQLAEMFHEVAKDYYIRILIETHSEYLIRKLRLLRAKDQVQKNEILIYYIYSPDDRPPEDECRIKKIEILDDGTMTNPFGKGFFDAADSIEMERFKANKSKN